MAFRPPCRPDVGEQLLTVSAGPLDERGQVVLHVAGDVDDYTVPLLQACLDTQVSRRGLRRLVVVLDRVGVLAPAGVAELARAEQRCRRRGARMQVRCGRNPAVSRVLDEARAAGPRARTGPAGRSRLRGRPPGRPQV